MPLEEHDVSMSLDTPYQVTKMLGELYCNFFYSHYALKTVRLRLFNSYGPGEVPGRYRNVIPNFVYWALKGQSLLITGTGQETRDFTYVGHCGWDTTGRVLPGGSGQGVQLGEGQGNPHRRPGQQNQGYHRERIQPVSRLTSQVGC